ncbi:Uncharacterised protein [Klebsiella quasipneumoniae]|nr:Uncharacterised protein [Klebsiella quasipneumoniae]
MCRVAAAPYPAYKGLPSAHIPRPTLTQRRREDIRLRAQHVAGWRFAYPAYKGLPSAHIPRPTLTQRRREGIRLRAQHVAGWRFAYPAYKSCPRFGARFAPFVGPRKRSAAGQGQRARSRFCAGGRLRLTRPTKPGLSVPSSRQTPRSAPPGSYCACCCACASWRTIASRRASPSGSRASNACRAATASG